MKRIIALITVVLLSISLLTTGCSKPQQENNKGNQDNQQGKDGQEKKLSGEITFSTWGSLEEKKMNEDIIALFESKYPGTKVKLEYIPEEYATKIDTMFLGKMAPDVIYGHPKQFATWASQNLLMDLTDRFNESPELMDENKFNTNLYEAFKYEGKNIATVNGADTLLLYYNKDLFDAANVAYPSENWTYDDLLDAAKKLTVRDENGKAKQFGISVGFDYQGVEAFVYANGGELFDDVNNPKEVLFNSPKTVEALQFMQDLIYVHKVSPTESDNEVLGGGFDTGKIAMIVDGVWSVVYRKNIEEFKWGLSTVPSKDGDVKKIPALYAGYALSTTTKNPDLAWEFAKFMQSDDAQKLLASSGLITVINKDISKSDEVIKIKGAPDNHMLRVTSLEKSIHNDAMIVNWDEYLVKYYNPPMDKLANGTIKAEDAAKEVQEGFEKMLKEKQ